MLLLAWWRDLRAAVAVGREINDIRDEWDEVRLDWADKRDAIDRLLRRLTLRESRSKSVFEAPEPPGPTNGDNAPLSANAALKLAIRERAREKGLLR
jgi:hypothetical protein